MQKTPHLIPALLALLIGIGAAVGFGGYARQLERRYISAMAPLLIPLKNQGSALQREAFAQDDLLPVYGSSELLAPAPYLLKYHGSGLLADYPTGFTIFPIGKQETAPIIHVQKLSAISSSLAGKKLIISLSPNWFFERDRMMSPDAYAGNFSVLHGFAAVTDLHLSRGLRRRIALRMLDYPQTLERSDLLRFMATRAADDSPKARIEYDLALPLAALQRWVYVLQDHWETVSFINDLELKTDVRHQPRPIDFSEWSARARREYAPLSNNNPFAVDNERWIIRYQRQSEGKANSRNDEQFLAGMSDAAKWWEDLDLLLAELKELGAKPAFICLPIHGRYFDYTGVSRAARARYYQKMRQAIEPYGFPFVDFSEHDEDASFLLDVQSHPSPRAWVYMDQVFDAFYHDRPLNPESAIRADAETDASEEAADLDPGSLDSRDGNSIVGWAWDKDNPNRTVTVQIFVDGSRFTVVAADQFREDLAASGRGDGRHGFIFPLPPSLADGKPHTIMARQWPSRILLNGNPLVVTFTREELAAAPAQPTTAPATQPATEPAAEPGEPGADAPDPGTLDGVTEQIINGWAWEPRHPDKSVTVEIYEGDRLIATTVADALRDDLVTAGKGNGRHAFTVQTPPALLDGKQHRLRAKIAHGLELVGSPLVVTLARPQPGGQP